MLKPDDIDAIIAEDVRRRSCRDAVYDPVSGRGASGRRVEVDTPLDGLPRALVPVEMTEDPQYDLVRNDATAWRRLRCRHDFDYWCISCATIKNKVTGAEERLRLNAPQRRVAAVMDDDRRAGRPIRLIMLKARQWGGSTLVQMYMAWIQSCHRRNWNSLICAHVKDTASGIRGMYTRLLEGYPGELWEGDEAPRFRPYERSTNVREIAGRGCRVTVGSSENQEAVRGADYAMAHLSETAFWNSTPKRTPEQFIRAVCGAIALLPYSLIAMESTANGVGNYFHSEWLRCRDGRGDKHAVFVPWYEIEIYRLEPPAGELRAFVGSLNAAEMTLWERGLCLDQIYWYRRKAAEYSCRAQMAAEFPSTDVEAFVNTGRGVFPHDRVAAMRAACTLPVRRGELDPAGRRFVEDDTAGCLQLWTEPLPEAQYVVAVDVGGRSAASDWSVIAVMRRPRADAPAEVAAQWRGHVDHDLLARKAAAVARFYNDALLVVESNTLESGNADAGGDSNLFVLERLAREYRHIYRRRSHDTLNGRPCRRIGFHTNRHTKALLVDGLVEAVREGGYIERDPLACDELDTYEQLPSGAYAAKEGYHDDMLMTRAIALYVIATEPAQVPPGPKLRLRPPI